MNHNLIKLEIILPAIYLNKLISLFNAAEVEGYSALEIALGRGNQHGEFRSNDLLTTSKSYLIFSILEKKQFGHFETTLEKFLKEYQGAYFVTEVLNSANIKIEYNE